MIRNPRTRLILIAAAFAAITIAIVVFVARHNGAKKAGAVPAPTHTPAAAASPEAKHPKKEKEKKKDETEGKYFVNGSNVCLREKADTESECLDLLYWGNQIEIIKYGEEWSRAKFGDKTGFIHSEFLSPESERAGVTGDEIAEYALKYEGVKYKWGGNDPETGFDCSGFTSFVFDHFGMKLNRIAGDQALNGTGVDQDAIQPGDIICFSYGGSITHVGIALGDGMVVHAANEKSGVITAELKDFEGADLVIRRMTYVPESKSES